MNLNNLAVGYSTEDFRPRAIGTAELIFSQYHGIPGYAAENISPKAAAELCRQHPELRIQR
jgi:hypothetical protein